MFLLPLRASLPIPLSFMSHTIQPATRADFDAIRALLPRLADFEVPINRNPKDLWQGDQELFNDWAAGKRDDVDVLVATESNQVLGAAIVSYRKEMLSGEPSAHLEVLVLAKESEGKGIASALMKQTEKWVMQKGAHSMSLHVFANNTRARALYEKEGYLGELLRYQKQFTE